MKTFKQILDHFSKFGCKVKFGIYYRGKLYDIEID